MDVLGSDLDEVRGDVHSISNKPYCAISADTDGQGQGIRKVLEDVDGGMAVVEKEEVVTIDVFRQASQSAKLAQQAPVIACLIYPRSPLTCSCPFIYAALLLVLLSQPILPLVSTLGLFTVAGKKAKAARNMTFIGHRHLA